MLQGGKLVMMIKPKVDASDKCLVIQSGQREF